MRGERVNGMANGITASLWDWGPGGKGALCRLDFLCEGDCTAVL